MKQPFDASDKLVHMISSRDIAIFYACIAFALLLIRLFPANPITRFVLTWIGPRPRQGERKSSYLWRWSLYGFGWFLQILTAELTGLYLSRYYASLEQNQLFQGIFWFALPLLGLVAIAGCIVAALAGIKSRLFGPNPSADLEAGMRRIGGTPT